MNSSFEKNKNKNIHWSTTSADCHGLVARGRFARLFSTELPASPLAACRHPVWRGRWVGIGCSKLRGSPSRGASISPPPPFPSRCTSRGGVEGWGLRSHELWLLHRLLVCGGVPRGVAGNVRSGRPHRSLHGGRWAPDRCHRGGNARQSAAGGQSGGVDRAPALFHQFLEFRALILKPNLHLQRQSKLLLLFFNGLFWRIMHFCARHGFPTTKSSAKFLFKQTYQHLCAVNPHVTAK